MRWHQIKVYRPPSGKSKSSRIAINRQQLPNYVRNWWQHKVSTGKFYKEPEAVLPGMDYEGDLNWPRRASFLSMYHDFIRSVGKEINCTHGQFIHYLHKYTPLDAGSGKTITYKREDGRKLWSASRSFIEIPGIENARQDIEQGQSTDRRSDQSWENNNNSEGAKWYPT